VKSGVQRVYPKGIAAKRSVPSRVDVGLFRANDGIYSDVAKALLGRVRRMRHRPMNSAPPSIARFAALDDGQPRMHIKGRGSSFIVIF